MPPRPLRATLTKQMSDATTHNAPPNAGDIPFDDLTHQEQRPQTINALPPAERQQLLEISHKAAAKARELGLSVRQETFAHLVASGIPQAHAYVRAGYSSDPDGARANAARLIALDSVSELIDFIRQEKLSQHVFTRALKRRRLYEIGMGDNDSNALRAIEIDNRMTGDDAPIRVEGEITLTGILDGLRPSLGLPDPTEAIDI